VGSGMGGLRGGDAEGILVGQVVGTTLLSWWKLLLLAATVYSCQSRSRVGFWNARCVRRCLVIGFALGDLDLMVVPCTPDSTGCASG